MLQAHSSYWLTLSLGLSLSLMMSVASVDASAEVEPHSDQVVKTLDLAEPAAKIQNYERTDSNRPERYFVERGAFWIGSLLSQQLSATQPDQDWMALYSTRINSHRRLEFGPAITSSRSTGSLLALQLGLSFLNHPNGNKWYTRPALQIQMPPEDRLAFFLRARNWQLQVGRGFEWIPAQNVMVRVELFLGLKEGGPLGGLLGQAAYAW